MNSLFEIFKIIKTKSFLVMFLLTLFLYGFSYGFPIVLYVFPTLFFIGYLYVNREVTFLIVKKAVYMYIYMAVFMIFLLLGGLIGLDFDIRIRTAMYILFFLFPISFIFYQEVNFNEFDVTYKNLLVTYVLLGLLIFTLHHNGVIGKNRYQQVGNILAATVILLFGLKDKIKKWLLILCFFWLVLLAGSRQALVGLTFCLLIYVFVINYKVFLGFVALVLLTFFNYTFLLHSVKDFGYKYSIETIKRMVYALETGGGSSVDIRFEIYANLIDKIKIYPNLSFSPNTDNLLPHNFFIEYFVTCGYLIGIVFIIFTFRLVIISIYKNKDNVLVYFAIFYFVPFNVSSGLSAAKYFIYYSFLLILIQHKKTIKIFK